MDAIDFEILKILNKDSRRSFLTIGKELGISGTAVRKKVEKMMDEGVIITFEVGFDSSLLQLSTCIADIRLKGNFKTGEIIAELKKIPTILFVICAVGNIFTLMFYYHDSRELEKIIERIHLINNVSNVETDIPRSHHFADVKLSPLDWKIIHSLNHDARKKNHQIARELEVSPKTIKRRLNRLIKDRIIYFTIDVDLSRAKNYIMYVLAVELETGVEKETVYARIKNEFSHIWATAGPVQPSIAFFMYADGLSEIGDVLEEVKRIPGVKKADVFLYTSWHRFTEWYDKNIEKMARICPL